MMWYRSFLYAVALGNTVAACVPKYLEKYRSSESGSEQVNDEPLRPTQGPDLVPLSSRPVPQQGGGARQTQEAVKMVDRSTFIIKQEFKEVWEATLTVLLKNYNVTVADKAVGVMTTEWDSFYLNNKVYRNKVSMRVRPLKQKETEVTVFNNVEELQSDAQNGAVAIWLPSDTGSREVGRIVQNLAIALNLPQPELPDDMIARSPNAAPKL